MIKKHTITKASNEILLLDLKSNNIMELMTSDKWEK